jgi:hypothetical protein
VAVIASDGLLPSLLPNIGVADACTG